MSKNLEESMSFTIRHSRLLRLIVSIVHALMLIACWLNALPAPYKCLLTILVLLNWRSKLVSGELNTVYLRYTPHQGWTLLGDGDHYLPIEIQASTVVTEFLIALNWAQNNGRRQSMIILKDAMSNDDYRKLLVWLLISGNGRR